MLTIELRDRQLQRCCDALSAVDADAPTLCEGWTAHDLAIHLWAIKHDPLSWPGIAVPALAGTTATRADRIRGRWTYPELVARLRADSGRIACMPLDRFEGHRHALGEYYVHSQDVARPNGLRQEPPDEPLEDALWLRARKAARLLHSRPTPGLVLERERGVSVQVTRGDPALILRGKPTELLCWVYGRRSVADVAVHRV